MEGQQQQQAPTKRGKEVTGAAAAAVAEEEEQQQQQQQQPSSSLGDPGQGPPPGDNAGYAEKWTVDPGRTDVFTAISSNGRILVVSNRSYRDAAKIIYSIKKIQGWKEGLVGELGQAIPTCRTASLARLQQHSSFLFLVIDELLHHHLDCNYRGLRFTRDRFRDKALADIAKLFVDPAGGRVLVVYGNYSNAGCIRGLPKAPIKKFREVLGRYVEVVVVDEHRSSMVGVDCLSLSLSIWVTSHLHCMLPPPPPSSMPTAIQSSTTRYLNSSVKTVL